MTPVNCFRFSCRQSTPRVALPTNPSLEKIFWIFLLRTEFCPGAQKGHSVPLEAIGLIISSVRP